MILTKSNIDIVLIIKKKKKKKKKKKNKKKNKKKKNKRNSPVDGYYSTKPSGGTLKLFFTITQNTHLYLAISSIFSTDFSKFLYQTASKLLNGALINNNSHC